MTSANISWGTIQCNLLLQVRKSLNANPVLGPFRHPERRLPESKDLTPRNHRSPWDFVPRLCQFSFAGLGLLDLAARSRLLKLRDAFALLKTTNFRYPPEVMEALLAQQEEGKNE